MHNNHHTGLGRGFTLTLIGLLLIGLGLFFGGTWTGFSIDPRTWHRTFSNAETIEDIDDDWFYDSMEQKPFADLPEGANESSDITNSAESESGSLWKAERDTRSGNLPTTLKKISVNTNFAHVQIRTGASSGYKISGFPNNSYTIVVSDTAFTFSEPKTNKHVFSNKKADRRSIEIILPLGIQFEDCNFSVGFGTINLKNLNCKNLRIEGGAGSVQGAGLVAQVAHLECGAGQFEIKDAQFERADVSTGVGRLYFEGDVTKTAQIESGLGAIELRLLGKEGDYDIRYERGLGSIQIGAASYGAVGNGRVGNPSASKQLKLNTGLGSISVSFKQ